MLAFLIRNVFIADELTSSRSLLAETLRRFAVHSRRLTQWVPTFVVGETPPMAHSEHRCRIVLWPVSGGSLAPSTTAGYIALAFALATLYISIRRSHARFVRIAASHAASHVAFPDCWSRSKTMTSPRRRPLADAVATPHHVGQGVHFVRSLATLLNLRLARTRSSASYCLATSTIAGRRSFYYTSKSSATCTFCFTLPSHRQH